MASVHPKRLWRDDPRERTKRDLERVRRRQPETGFWSSLALIGSVGWPIALLAAGGAWLGRYLDSRWQTGVRFSLILLTLAATIGTAIAFRSVREDRPR